MSDTLVFLIEHPWGYDRENTASVVPFFQGLQKLYNKFDFKYASGCFPEKAVANTLREYVNVTYKQIIIVVAAHGNSSGNKAGCMTLRQYFKVIKDLREDSRYVDKKATIGLYFGSCNMGKNVDKIIDYVREAKLRWFIGYKYSNEWLKGTFIDTIIIDVITKRRKDIGNKALINELAKELAFFSPFYQLGDEQYEATGFSLTLIAPKRLNNYRASNSVEDLSEKLSDAIFNKAGPKPIEDE